MMLDVEELNCKLS